MKFYTQIYMLLKTPVFMVPPAMCSVLMQCSQASATWDSISSPLSGTATAALIKASARERR